MTNTKISELPLLSTVTAEVTYPISRSLNSSNVVASIGELKRSMGPAFTLTGNYVDRMGERAVNTNYQNTQNMPLHILVCLNRVSGSGEISLFSDASTAPTTRVGHISLPTTNYEHTLQFIVPANHYYRIVGSGVSVISWVERSLSVGSAIPSTQPTLTTQVKFDELSGPVMDSITNTALIPTGVNFTLNAGTFRSKPFITFSGTNTYFEVPGLFPVSTGLAISFSWSVWIRRNSTPTTDEFFIIANHFNTAGTSGFVLLVDDDSSYRPFIQTSVGNLFTNTSAVTVLDNWHHVAVVYNGYDFCLFFDGVLQSSRLQTNEPMRLASSTPLHIGRSLRGLTGIVGSSNISIRDFRVYNKPLNHFEVSKIIENDDYQITGLMREEKSVLEHYLRSSVKFSTGYSIATTSPVLTSGDWSISGWVKFADIPSECVVFSQQTGGVVYRLSLFAENTYWTRLQLKIGATTITPNAYLYYDHWIFFVVTKSGTTYNIYVDDGNEYGKANASGSSATTPSNVPLSFGSAGGLPSFNGNIACVSFYNSVLTATDAANLFKLQNNLKKLPSRSGLNPINEWTMEIKDGNLISDNIGKNNIVISGAANNINVPWQESTIALNPNLTLPSLFWQFNGTINSAGAATYVDSISGLVLTASNAANTLYVAGPMPGVQGLRLSLGGSSGFLTAGASTLLNNLTDNDFTIGFYYYPLGTNGAASNPRMISKANSGSKSGYEFVRDEGFDLVSFLSGNGSTFDTLGYPKVTNGSAWDYWTIVYVKLTKSLSLYRHGTCIATSVLSGPIAKNTNPLLIGALAGGAELELGSVASIAIWQQALSEHQIFAAQSLKV